MQFSFAILARCRLFVKRFFRKFSCLFPQSLAPQSVVSDSFVRLPRRFLFVNIFFQFFSLFVKCRRIVPNLVRPLGNFKILLCKSDRLCYTVPMVPASPYEYVRTPGFFKRVDKGADRLADPPHDRHLRQAPGTDPGAAGGIEHPPGPQ